MARIKCYFCKTTFLKAYGAQGNGTTSHMSFNIRQFCDYDPATYKHSCRRLYHTNQVFENVRGRDRAEGESEDSTNDDFVTCHTSTYVTSTLNVKKNVTEAVTDVIKW